MEFFRLISRKQVVGHMDAVFIYKKSHFNDWVGTAVFLRSSFSILWLDFAAVFINRFSVIIQNVCIGAADIKVIVGTVKISNRKVAFRDFSGMVKDPFLEGFLVSGNDVKRIVNIIETEAVETLKENIPPVIGFFLRTGVEYSGKYKKAENLVNAVINRKMPCFPVPELIEF